MDCQCNYFLPMMQFLLPTMHFFYTVAGEALPGMDIAVSTMKKGETSRFLISSMYAFGEMGCPPRIPPNATILFEIELLSFVDRAGVDEFYALRGVSKFDLFAFRDQHEFTLPVLYLLRDSMLQ